MRFQFEKIDSLPRLAWCARLVRGDECVRVIHGPWVETREDRFVEGAWDGPFATTEPDAATTLTGTAGRITEGRAVFATSTNLHDRLQLYRSGNELFVSNSLVFLLVEAGDAPDPDYLFYAHDLCEQLLAGIRRRQRTLPTRTGKVVLHECGNLLVGPNLRVVRGEKPAPKEPTDYAAYVEMLETSIGRVFENAADPARHHAYEPLATVSRGYDSTAVAALAKRRGCSEAVTFGEDRPGEPDPDDNGKPVGIHLGLHVTEYARRAYLSRPGLPEAEFAAVPPGDVIVLASLEEHLVGRLLLTGRFGDVVGELDPAKIQPDLRQHTIAAISGSTMTEFRLRVGFLNFPPLFAGWQHIRAVHRIATSEALAPWSVGGDYDRPIARRILEEAGVPRELFGQRKMAGGRFELRDVAEMSDEASADIQRFVREHRPSRKAVKKIRRRCSLHARNVRANAAVARITGGALELPVLVPRRYSEWPRGGLTFHWGFHRTRARYAPASEG